VGFTHNYNTFLFSSFHEYYILEQNAAQKTKRQTHFKLDK